MALTIQLEKNPARNWFTSTECITGQVVLHIRKLVTITDVVLSLRGKQTQSIRIGDPAQGGVHWTEKHIDQLLSRDATLLPLTTPSGQRLPNVLRPGCHYFPFSLTIPLFADSFRKGQKEPSDFDTPLPPSFQVSSNSLKVEVVYHFKAVVHRPGILVRDLTAAHNIDIRPLQPPSLPNCYENPHYQKVSSYLPGEELGLVHKIEGQDTPPPYSPSIDFKIVFLSPNIIYPGDHVALRIVVKIPKEIQHVAGILWMTRFTILIRETTTVREGVYARSHVNLLDICDVRGKIPIPTAPGGGAVNLPSGLWEHQTYPYMFPSFESRGLRMSHQLEIEAHVMSESKWKIHTLSTALDVHVKSGLLALDCARIPWMICCH